MQTQISNSQYSQDKYSLISKTGRRLYRNINNNIRVLNKSRVSNHSNQSKGSIALRRTQLSNDKIYSRQEEFNQFNSSQLGVDMSGLNDAGTHKTSVPMTPIQSTNNYRQRMKQSLSQRSLRANSQRSDKQRSNNGKKLSRQQIQMLFMMEGQKGSQNRESYKVQRQSSRNREKYEKSSVRNSSKRGSSRQRDFYRYKDTSRQRQRQKDTSRQRQIQKELNKYDLNKVRSIKSIKSSQKSHFKNPTSKNLKQLKNNHPQLIQNSNYQIKKLSQKYQYNYGVQSVQKKKRVQNQNIQDQRDKKYHNKHDSSRNDQSNYEEQRRLHKYKSQKYIPIENEVNRDKKRSARKQQTYFKQPSEVNNNEYEKYNIRDDKYNPKQSHRRREKQPQRSDVQYKNSLQKYQKQSIKRHVPPRQCKDFNKYDSNQQSSNNYQLERNQKKDKQNYYKKINSQSKNSQRSSILNIRSKHSRSQMKNIRIKQEEYSNLYSRAKQNSSRQSDYYSRNNQNKRSTKQNDKMRKYNKNHQYYDHINSTYSRNDINMNQERSKRTQISQTFDSLILSINSRITGLNSQSNLKATIDKITLHVNTLNLLSDYTQQFMKMYEQTQQWEQLIFLSHKKFWVQRVKVLNYIKKFRKHKRHQSQRLRSSNSKRNILGHKLTSIKNICSQNNRQAQSPFDDIDLIENPFTIPFCKLSQSQVKQVAQSQQGAVMIQKLQKQNQQTYKGLQQMYNFIIQKSGNHINMIFCDNFSDDTYILMLEEIEQLIPNLETLSLFQVTKIRLGKIVKAGILMLFLNGKYIRNIAEIITYDDSQKIGAKKKIKTFTSYDLYYEVFQKLVIE